MSDDTLRAAGDDDGPYHVTPENDWREHVLDPQGACPCLPTRHYDQAPLVWIHNAYDGRELREGIERALDMLGMALVSKSHRWSPALRWVYEHAHALVKMHMPNHVAYRLSDDDRRASKYYDPPHHPDYDEP